MSQLQVTGEAKIRDIQGPVVANSGVITALDGAASQYVRGDGTLADFPTSSGGGSSVSYYLNSSVSQGTIGGVAYRELSKEPIIGAGTDIAISSNGYVASYITDVNDPDVILIPGGNFNCEFYFSVNNNTGNPNTYAELYKYDGTTFTLLGSSVGVPESINQGTTIAPYYFAIPVATANLSLTDRLAIRIYVNVDGRTVTLHTENGHLCQVVTTLSKGMVSLNNLTDQSQYLTTGTSGTDFNIASSGDTHTFNIPSASASNRGLITTGSQTIAGIKTLSVPSQFEQGLYLKQNMNLFQAGYIGLGASTTGLIVGLSGGGFGTLNFNNTTSFTYTFPNATGTIALTSNLSSYVPYTGATANVDLGNFNFDANNISGGSIIAKLNGPASSPFVLKTGSSGYTIGDDAISLVSSPTTANTLILASNIGVVTKTAQIGLGSLSATRTFTLPDLSGTLALLEGTQTFTGDKLFNGSVDFNNSVNINSGLFIRNNVIGSTLYTSFTITKASSTQTLSYLFSTGFASNLLFNDAANYSYTFPASSGTIALTSNLSSYVPYTGATTNVDLGAYSLTANQLIAGGANIDNVATFSTYDQGHALKLKGSTGDLFFVPYFSPSIGARITAQNSAASANTPLSFYASNFYFNSNVNFGSTLGNGTYTYTLPAATGTLALTSNLSAYLPLTGGTLTGALTGTSATFSGNGLFGGSTNAGNAGGFTLSVGVPGTTAGGIQLWAATNQSSFLQFGDSTTAADNYRGYIGYNHATDTLSLGTASADRLTIASTGAATFSSSITAVRGTMNGTDGDYAFFINGGATAGSSYGLRINAGGNSSDYAIRTKNAAQSSDLFVVRGDGKVGIGGVTNPSYAVSVGSANGDAIGIQNGSANTSNLYFSQYSNEALSYTYIRADARSTGYMAFHTNDTERMRIFSSGGLNVLSSTGDPFCIQLNSGVKLRADSSTQMGIVNAAITSYADLRVQNMTKASGSFRISHPLESLSDTHDLVHSFVESPQANNIYRGKVQLVDGKAEINLDEVSTMTEGTFVLLNREIHTYTSNETDWDAVRGKVEGNILTIECQNNASNAIVSWLVIGERQDKHMMDTAWTDDNGRVIVEPLKEIKINNPIQEDKLDTEALELNLDAQIENQVNPPIVVLPLPFTNP